MHQKPAIPYIKNIQNYMLLHYCSINAVKLITII